MGWHNSFCFDSIIFQILVAQMSTNDIFVINIYPFIEKYIITWTLFTPIPT